MTATTTVRLLGAAAGLAVLGACSAEPEQAAAPPVPSVDAPPAPTTPPPAPTTTPPPPPPTTTAAPKPERATPDNGCGTVTAASGFTLEVLDEAESGVPCAEARSVVERFHRAIAGKQPAGSQEPVSETVDGWLCVSGAPTAQGGTTCGNQDRTVLAAVVPLE
ncbi:hypothetical protein [Amycolatopsis sp. 195334CR]|uniref:hypothetical protein n=1 Tax=Amycolatopsis sp. 195334CR TaxID=2814588 RepID=UPI001F5D62B2|nr:hypothetical protein [Amycolatopsis sp. 195334CR]